MKKLIDIDEYNLIEFRKNVSLQFPVLKITDKALVNLSLVLALHYIKKYKVDLMDFLKI